jgi:hypothetical protein
MNASHQSRLEQFCRRVNSGNAVIVEVPSTSGS